ncbi:MAG: hypothetical protein CL916_13345 [Deltaproteobacteria bacterium]|nr:hypothetical protein [Deltaproteobacteria bacterium]
MSRYRYIRPLGQGTSGQSYLAEDVQNNQKVVIKRFFHNHSQSKDRETMFLQQLQHPAIPSFVDNFVEEIDMVSRFHLVTEYIDGASIQEQFVEPWSIAVQLFPILEYLHEQDPPVLHRDIKPSNLIWSSDNTLHLIDFGAAIHCQDRTFGNTIMAGTLGYQAPEQIKGEPTPSSDLYSTGALLVELLSGKSAFSMLSDQVLDWEDEVDLPAIAVLWLRRLLHRNPNERFASAKEALFELDPVLKAVHSHPITASHHPRRWLTLFAMEATKKQKEKWKGWVLLQERATKGADWGIIAQCWKLLGEQEAYQRSKEKEYNWKKNTLKKLQGELLGEGVTIDINQLLDHYTMKNLQNRLEEDLEEIRTLNRTDKMTRIRVALQQLSRHYSESQLHSPCVLLEEKSSTEVLAELESLYESLGFVQRRQHVRFLQTQMLEKDSQQLQDLLRQFSVEFSFPKPVHAAAVAEAKKILAEQQNLHKRSSQLKDRFIDVQLDWIPLARPYSKTEMNNRESVLRNQEVLSTQWEDLRKRAQAIHWEPKDFLRTPITLEVFQTALEQQEEYWERIETAERRAKETISFAPKRPSPPYDDPEHYEEIVQEQLMLHASLMLALESYPQAVHSLLKSPKPPYTRENIDNYMHEANILASNRRAERLLKHRYRGLILAPILGVLLYLGWVQWNLQQDVYVLHSRFPNVGQTIPHPSCLECPPISWPRFPYQKYEIQAFHTYLLEHEQRMKRFDSLLGQAKKASLDIEEFSNNPSLKKEAELKKALEEQYIPIEKFYLLQRDAQRLRISTSDWKAPLTNKEYLTKFEEVERARSLHEQAEILQNSVRVAIPFEYPLTSIQIAEWKNRVEKIPKVQKLFTTYAFVTHRIPYEITSLQKEIDQRLFMMVMDRNPSSFQNEKYSVHNINWFDAVKFADLLNWYLQEPSCYVLSDDDVRWIEGCSAWRLPTKEEWTEISKKESKGRYWENNRFSFPKGGAFRGDLWELVWDRYEEPLLEERPYILGGSWLTPRNRTTRTIPLYGKGDNITFRLVRADVQGFPSQPDQQRRSAFDTRPLSDEELRTKGAFRVLLNRNPSKAVNRQYAKELEDIGLLAEAEELYKQSGANLCMSVRLRRSLDSICDPFLPSNTSWLMKEKAGLAILEQEYGTALRLMETCSSTDISCFFAKIRMMLMIGKQEEAKEEYCLLSASQRKSSNISIACDEFRIPTPRVSPDSTQ